VSGVRHESAAPYPGGGKNAAAAGAAFTVLTAICPEAPLRVSTITLRL